MKRGLTPKEFRPIFCSFICAHTYKEERVGSCYKFVVLDSKKFKIHYYPFVLNFCNHFLTCYICEG